MAKRSVGRPSKYKKIYAKKLVSFFDVAPTKILKEYFHYKNGDTKEKDIEVAIDFPTLVDFYREMKIDDSTFKRWLKKHKEFRAAYLEAKELQKDIWKKNSLKGLYAQPFAIFMGKNVFGWKDKNETDVTLTEKPAPIYGGKSTKK